MNQVGTDGSLKSKVAQEKDFFLCPLVPIFLCFFFS